MEQAMQNYRRFLEESPETAMTPEAMRRLADLQLEKQFGIRTGDAKPRELAAPEIAALAETLPGTPDPAAAAAGAGFKESDQDFEQRTTAEAAGLSRRLALAARIPNCFSSCRSARRRIASGVIAASGASARKRR